MMRAELALTKTGCGRRCQLCHCGNSFLIFFHHIHWQRRETKDGSGKVLFPKDSSPNKAVDTKIQNAGKNKIIFANIADVCVSGRMGKEEAGCARGREHPAEREPTNAMIQMVMIIKTSICFLLVTWTVGLKNQRKNWKSSSVMEEMWSLALHLALDLDLALIVIQCESKFH